MDNPAKNKATEAIGISRSGRVCKKSSMLADFESPDEIDRRYKRKKDRPPKVVTPKAVREDSDFYVDKEVIDVKDEPLEVEEWGVEGEGMLEGADTLGEGNLLEFSDPLQVDEGSTDVAWEPYNYTQAQSLYFSEEQGKQSTTVKGRPAAARKKAHRKDKGKPRFTAYMLWAREVRPEIVKENQHMSFIDINKRLGELWARVPTSQKYNWKRRAKRLSVKGVQKGGRISTNHPPRPPPPARAGLTKKVGMESAPSPDPNPAPPPPSLASQDSGQHQQPEIKHKQSRRKKPQAQESSTITAPTRLAMHPLVHGTQTFTSAAAVKKKRLDQDSARELYTIMHKGRLCESLPQGPQPPDVPALGRKHAREEKALDQKQEHWQLVAGGEETEVSDETNNMKEVLRQRPEQQLEGSMETDCAVASPGDDAETDTVVATDNSISSKPCTVSDIFLILCAGRLSPFCPVSLARALASMTLKRLTLKKASTLYCVSPSRLQKCFSHMSSLRHGKRAKYDQLLKEMRHYPVHEAVREWLLRMRRMGRSPVHADVMQVFRFTGKNQKITGQLEGILSLYSRQRMSQEEWAVLSPAAAARWQSIFQDHMYVRCGINPYKFLTPKNSLQVFTSAEVLVGLGGLSREVIVARGKSNLYCLTQQGTARAVLTFSAAGQFHSPVIIQKGYFIPHWALEEDSVDLLASPDGRWDPLLFLSWLRLFERRLTQAAVPRPVVLFVHGHPAHASPAADAFCVAKGIILHSHHHSPINPMDPFIHLLPPLLHHLARTQEQLTALTGVCPLPDRLLPAVLADAWTQVSEENLAGEAFEKACLVPFTFTKFFPLQKYTKMSRFPPLLLQPLKSYFAVGDFPAELPYTPEPHLTSTYQLHVEELRHKLSIVDRVIVTSPEEPTIADQVDEEEMTDQHSNETCEVHCIAPEPASCEALCMAPEPACDPSMAESGEVTLMQNDGMSNVGSPADNSSDKSLEPLDELPLKCEIQEELTSPKSTPSSPEDHSRPASCTGWEDKDASDSSSQACDPLYVGPDPLSDPSVMESERIVHIHNNLMACLSSSTDCSSEKPPEEELDSSAACEVQEPNSQNVRTEYVAFEPNRRGLSERHSRGGQPHSTGNPEPVCDFTNLVLLKDETENEEVT